jgi:hypothetical protein
VLEVSFWYELWKSCTLIPFFLLGLIETGWVSAALINADSEKGSGSVISGG